MSIFNFCNPTFFVYNNNLHRVSVGVIGLEDHTKMRNGFLELCLKLVLLVLLAHVVNSLSGESTKDKSDGICSIFSAIV